jgi:serine/threonine protein kinase
MTPARARAHVLDRLHHPLQPHPLRPPRVHRDLALQPDLPAHIGKYRVASRLGTGATSEVFLAHDRFNDRPVAIKRVQARPHATEVETRFSNRFFAAEAALVGKLNHPNVVQLLDAVEEPDSRYLVMEYVPGVTLRHFCSPERLLSLEQVVEVGFKCAMALGYMYRQGLVHRDVKPANILVTTDGDDITDAEDQRLRQRAGPGLGPDPDPPRRLAGLHLARAARRRRRGLPGRHLFPGRGALPPDRRPPALRGRQPGALLNMIWHREPDSLVGSREGVTEALDQVIRHALAKKAEDRPADWDDFANQLSALITNNEVPRGPLQRVLDSERFTLLRSLDFFTGFGDVELWEVVHRARWQRFPLGHHIYKAGQEGRRFHIIAQGEVEVFRDGQKVASFGAGTSVGELAYLAPSAELRKHSADVVVSEPCTTISFTPDALEQLSERTRHRFDSGFIRVLVRRLHEAHEALRHPQRIL